MKILSEKELQIWLYDHLNWLVDNNEIICTFTFKDFYQAMGFITQVGILAEKNNHHPTILNTYNIVTLSMTTHDAGNKITDRDIKLAEDIENLNIY